MGIQRITFYIFRLENHCREEGLTMCYFKNLEFPPLDKFRVRHCNIPSRSVVKISGARARFIVYLNGSYLRNVYPGY